MRYIFILFTCSIAFAGCNNNSPTATNSTADSSKTITVASKAQAQSKLGEAGTGKLVDLVNKYYVLKNALVATKSADANNAATQLIAIGDTLQAFLQKDAANTALKPFVDTIITQSKTIAGMTDESCEKMRIQFSPLSNALFGLIRKAELKNVHLYRQYCPMALNEKGASWLSDDPEIKNPYFGKKMMECGETTDSL